MKNLSQQMLKPQTGIHSSISYILPKGKKKIKPFNTKTSLSLQRIINHTKACIMENGTYFFNFRQIPFRKGLQ